MNETNGRLSRRALLIGAVAAMSSRRAAAGTAPSAAGHRHEAGLPDLQQEASTSQDTPVGRLGNPWVAGQPRARPTEYDNDAFVIAIENQLKCNCGCAHSLYACRTTDFSCQFWQPLHAEVVEMVQQDMTAEEIIDAYVTKYGTQYRMAPPAQGFNLAGYLVPGVVLTFVAAGMLWLLGRKSRLAAAHSAEPVTASTTFSPEDEARLNEELKKLQV